MISLFLNTSSKMFNTAIVKDGKVLDSIYENYGKDLSKEALYKISIMLDNNNLKISDIDEIVCVKGPGSFTGLRIGVTIAKTISYFLNKKLYSTSSLNIMASSVKGEIIVPIIDARRGYVYGAIYDEDCNIIMEECYIKLEDIIERAKMYSDNPLFVSLPFNFSSASVFFK